MNPEAKYDSPNPRENIPYIKKLENQIILTKSIISNYFKKLGFEKGLKDLGIMRETVLDIAKNKYSIYSPDEINYAKKILSLLIKHDNLLNEQLNIINLEKLVEIPHPNIETEPKSNENITDIISRLMELYFRLKSETNEMILVKSGLTEISCRTNSDEYLNTYLETTQIDDIIDFNIELTKLFESKFIHLPNKELAIFRSFILSLIDLIEAKFRHQFTEDQKSKKVSLLGRIKLLQFQIFTNRLRIYSDLDEFV